MYKNDTGILKFLIKNLLFFNYSD